MHKFVIVLEITNNLRQLTNIQLVQWIECLLNTPNGFDTVVGGKLVCHQIHCKIGILTAVNHTSWKIIQANTDMIQLSPI